jgi:hypothetical protein
LRLWKTWFDFEIYKTIDMSVRYRPTGCARFFVFLIIVIPLTIFGVSLYNGVSFMDVINDVTGRENIERVSTSSSKSKKSDELSLREYIKELEERLDACESALKESRR